MILVKDNIIKKYPFKKLYNYYKKIQQMEEENENDT